MKTDQILTMDEYVAQWSRRFHRITPPTVEARHIPISVKEDGHSKNEARHCRCDRWGHPCSGCVELKPETRTRAGDFR